MELSSSVINDFTAELTGLKARCPKPALVVFAGFPSWWRRWCTCQHIGHADEELKHWLKLTYIPRTGMLLVARVSAESCDCDIIYTQYILN